MASASRCTRGPWSSNHLNRNRRRQRRLSRVPHLSLTFLQPPSSEYSQEPADAGSPNRRRCANAADVKDALTQMIQTLLGLQQQQSELAQQHQAPQALQPDVPEDPAYDWDRLHLPMATSFPVLCTGRVQRMASELPTFVGRDQKEATFVLNMKAD